MKTLLTGHDPAPLFEQLKTNLKVKISHGTYKPADKLPPQTKLAKTFGVSQITVRRAIQELVNEGLLVARPGSGTYVSTQDKVKQPVIKSKTIAIIFKDIVGGFPLVKPLFSAIRERCKAIDYDLQFIELPIDKKSQPDTPSSLELNIGGAILASPVDIPLLHKIQKLKIPYVLLHNEIADGASYSVSCNYVSGAVQAATYLLKQNCKDILLITAEETRYSAGQLKMGFELALKNNQRCKHKTIHVSYNEDDAYPIIQKYIDDKNLPDGIILPSTGITRMVANLLKYVGSAIAKETILISFGNHDFNKPDTNIISIEPHNDLTGTKAMQVLEQLIKGEKPVKLRELIEPELKAENNEK